MMKSLCAALAALTLAACAAAPAPTTHAPVDQMIAAERAFAAEAGRIGWVEAFEATAAPDALMPGNADLESARTQLANIHPDNRGDRSLTWAPGAALMSASGDLGLTVGRFNGGDTAFGTFFTVWALQADGDWKWIYDGGVDMPGPVALPVEVPVLAGGLPGNDGVSGVEAAEAAFAVAALIDARAAYAGALAADARVLRDGKDAGIGSGDPPAGAMRFERRGTVRPSGAADLAWTHGDATWTGANGERRAIYSRVWRRDAGGWRIVADALLPR